MFENIKAELARRNMSAKDLAKVIGLNKTTIATRMVGISQWKAPELERMADFFKCSVDYLLGRESKFDKGS